MALTKVKLIADGVITSANLDASHGITTSDIGEGSNLYYTDSRVSSYLSTNGFATQTDIIAAITDSAPVTLDTLNELAAALGDDPNFATTTATSLGLKAPLASPSFTGNVGIKNTVASTIDSASALGTLVVGDGSSVEGITIYTGTGNYGGLNFADATSGGGAYAGYIKFDHSDNSFGHYIGNAEKMGIDSSGNVSVGTDTPLYLYSEQGVAQVAANRVSSNGTIIDTSSSAAYINLYTPNTGSYITFHTANAINTSPSERMRITSGGDIEINGGDIFLNSGTNYNDKGVVYLSNERTAIISDIVNLTANGDTSLDFQTRSAGTRASAMFIDEFRNIGIGTTSISSAVKLHVDGGDLRVRDSGNVAFQIISSTSANSAIQFGDDGDANDGRIVYENTGDNMKFYTLDAEKMRIDSSGNVGINQTNPNDISSGATTLHITGTVTSKAGAIRLDSSDASVSAYIYPDNTNGLSINTNTSHPIVFRTAATERMRIDSSGNTIFPNNGTYFRHPGTYSRTTASSANMFIYTDGQFYRSTSSLKYKTNVNDYDKGLNEVLLLRPVYYNGTGDSDGNKRFSGLIAEEVHDLGLTEFVEYAEDGTPDGLAYGHMIALLTKSIQELKADNDNLRERIQTLENQ